MSKQTAVEWLQERLLLSLSDELKSLNGFFVIAKEMEKEQNIITEETSDGYHTFKELYEFRKVYNAALFNEWANYDIPKYDVHKSWKHHDDELCFGGGWFIVVALLPSGQISNHYEAKDWDLFNIPSAEKAKYAFDGHDSRLVIRRIKKLNDLKK
jgi:hypothetical protein